MKKNGQERFLGTIERILLTKNAFECVSCENERGLTEHVPNRSEPVLGERVRTRSMLTAY